MPERSRLLGGISPRRFLREYWQQKPLLVRDALPGFGAELSAEELAGLALEPEIESRLVIERGDSPWTLRRGPFTARDFGRLPSARWTLLVQAVDQWVPAARALRERFDFLPGWRFDDVMVSYAADKGGVGPHVDQYDVFLVQGAGRRRWRIGQRCDATTPLRRDTELRILKHFHTEAEYLLGPGDMLYLPPGLAHWGSAEGPCMTWSVGFRAPSAAEIVQEIAGEAAARLPEDRRFADPGVAWPRDGEITRPAIARIRRLLEEALADEELLADWFARYMTERKYPELEIAPARKPAKGIAALLARGVQIERHPASRFADPGVAWPRDGEITRPAIARIRRLLEEALADEELLADWFARYMTERKYPELEIAPARKPAKGIAALLARGVRIERHPASRFAWREGRPARLFVDGESFPCPTALARLLCAQAPLPEASLRAFAAKPAACAVLDALLARGALQRAG